MTLDSWFQSQIRRLMLLHPFPLQVEDKTGGKDKQQTRKLKFQAKEPGGRIKLKKPLRFIIQVPFTTSTVHCFNENLPPEGSLWVLSSDTSNKLLDWDRPLEMLDLSSGSFPWVKLKWDLISISIISRAIEKVNLEILNTESSSCSSHSTTVEQFPAPTWQEKLRRDSSQWKLITFNSLWFILKNFLTWNCHFFVIYWCITLKCLKNQLPDLLGEGFGCLVSSGEEGKEPKSRAKLSTIQGVVKCVP